MRMSTTSGTWPVELRLEPGQPSVLQAAPFASRLSDGKAPRVRGDLVWTGSRVVVGLSVPRFHEPEKRTRSQKPGNILLPDAIFFVGF